MCGRYVTITKVKAVEERFGVKAAEGESIQPNINVSPGQRSAVITSNASHALQFFQFGFTPSWAKKPTYVINARSEGDQNPNNDRAYHGGMGIIHKPMFRSSIRNKRCLVVADAFIEGPQKEKLSKPFLVYPSNGKRPFAFAGIWDEWVNTSTGEVKQSFAIITTQASEVLHRIGHHRSPVVLQEDDEALWLSSDADLNDVTSVLKPFPDEQFNAYPISSAIKSPNATDPSLLKPIGERIFPSLSYSLDEEIKLEGMGETASRQRRLFD